MTISDTPKDLTGIDEGLRSTIDLELIGLKNHRDQEKKHKKAGDALKDDLLPRLKPFVAEFETDRFSFGEMEVLIVRTERATISRDNLREAFLGMVGHKVTVKLVDELIEQASKTSISVSLRPSKAVK